MQVFGSSWQVLVVFVCSLRLLGGCGRVRGYVVATSAFAVAFACAAAVVFAVAFVVAFAYAVAVVFVVVSAVVAACRSTSQFHAKRNNNNNNNK